jgi:copper chaperone CopZ
MSERTLSIDIGGMSCDGCVNSVTRVLSRLPGVRVSGVTVGNARVSAPDTVPDASLTAAIEKAGFRVGEIRPDAKD